MSNLPTHDVEINGKSFRITALTVKDARPLQFQLAKVLAPVLTAATGDAAAIGASLVSVVEGLSLDTYENVCKVLLRNTEYLDGSGAFRLDAPGAQDRAFACDYGTMLQVLAAGLEFNFASFFADLGITLPR